MAPRSRATDRGHGERSLLDARVLLHLGAFSLLTLGALAHATPFGQLQPEASPPAPASLSEPQRLANWREDIDALVEQLPRKHKNLFFRCPKETWLARAGEIREKVPTLTDTQIFIELRRLVALIGDAHTTIRLADGSPLPSPRTYPIATIRLADGVFAPVLPREHEKLIGQRLVRIGSLPIDKAIDRVAEVRAYDNDSGRRDGTMQDLRDAGVLACLGLADPDQASFTLVDAAGRETTLTLNPVPPGASLATLVAQHPDPRSFPAWRSFRRAPYGHEILADRRTFYIWYDTCSNRGDTTVAQFTKATLAALDAELAKNPSPIDRVAIDFRRNGGGNSALFMPMIDALAHRDWLMEPGRLFGLIGSRTFSSGMMNAYQLRDATQCTLVGEPSGGSPNGYGEVRTFELPHSRITVQYSTKLFRGVKEDTDALYPDIIVEPDSKSYFDGRDAVLDRITGPSR